MHDVKVAFENVRSLFNIGAMFRTCAFFGVKDVYLIGYTGKRVNQKGVVVLHQEITKTSLGAENFLQLHFIESTDAFLHLINFEGSNLVCAEQSPSSIPLNDWEPAKNSVIVFGNEIEGVSAQLLERAAVVVEIPGAHGHNSLNITTACGIVLAKASCPQSMI